MQGGESTEYNQNMNQKSSKIEASIQMATT